MVAVGTQRRQPACRRGVEEMPRLLYNVLNWLRRFFGVPPRLLHQPGQLLTVQETPDEDQLAPPYGPGSTSPSY